ILPYPPAGFLRPATPHAPQMDICKDNEKQQEQSFSRKRRNAFPPTLELRQPPIITISDDATTAADAIAAASEAALSPRRIWRPPLLPEPPRHLLAAAHASRSYTTGHVLAPSASAKPDPPPPRRLL
uniref:Uncharacterized protein n=1 Tax=Aegilops tauschii subsp. strangulata TaxID=200361 RepID=A0A453HJI0_AEGTS